MKSDPVVILAARRTPVGAFQGAFATVTAPQLGSVAIKAALADSGVAASQIDEVILGCVLSAGIGQAPARQAALGGGIPAGIPTTTVNKKCGTICSMTVCKAPGTDNSWVVLPKPRRRSTSSPAKPRTISPPSRCAGRWRLSPAAASPPRSLR